METAAQAVLDARVQYPTSTLANLYDPLTMPAPLLQAHQELDRAVDRCYRPEPFPSNRHRVEYLVSWCDQKRKGLCDQKRNDAPAPLPAGQYPLAFTCFSGGSAGVQPEHCLRPGLQQARGCFGTAGPALLPESVSKRKIHPILYPRAQRQTHRFAPLPGLLTLSAFDRTRFSAFECYTTRIGLRIASQAAN